MMGYWGNMMGFGSTFGMGSVFVWFWTLVWTLNSVLVSMVLVLLIEKLSRKK